MRKTLGALGPVMLALSLFAAAVAGCSRQESAAPPEVDVGAPAPDFALKTLDGTQVRLSELRGKVVFVNLWATWCPPCREELPTMVRFYRAYRDRGVEILAVSEDRDPRAVRKALERYGIPFPVLLDENKRVYNLYRATGIPETHLIDRQGIIRHTVIGPFDWTAPEVARTVEALLGEGGG